MRRQLGFSLIELVVVMVIAAILAALAIPRLTDTESKVSWFHEQVKAAVRYAQRQAVAQRRCVFVDLSATDPQLRLFYGNGSCIKTAVPLAEVTTGAAYALSAPPGAALAPMPLSFSFSSIGQPSSGVSFSTGAGTITVNAGSGYVQ